MVAHSPHVAKVHHSPVVNRSPVFYGWVIWIVGALAIIAAAPGLGFTVSLFFDHYIDDFALSRTEISTMFGVGTFMASLGLAWLGRKIDQHGNRQVGIVATILFMIVLVMTSAISGWLTMFVSFFALRYLAISMHLLGSTAIARWWQQRRGWVVGLALVLAALFRWRYLPFLQSLIEQHGWRTTWVILGVSLGVIILPIWAMFMRNRPEQYGLLPDGEKTKSKSSDTKPKRGRHIVEENWTLYEARHTLTFWVFMISRATAGVIGSGLVLHQVSIFAQVGHSETVTAETFGTVSLISVGMTMFVGWLTRRVRPGVLIAMQHSLMIGTLLLITVMTDSWHLTLYALVFGAAWGFGGTFDGTVWADLFGRQHHGAIRGFVTTIHMIGTSIGPIFYGVSYDYFGSYLPVVVVGVAVFSVEIILCLLVKSPQKTPEMLANPS